MPRAKQVDNPETLEDESLLDVPDDSADAPDQELSAPAQADPTPQETPSLTDQERAGYALSLRGLESLRLTTFCPAEAASLRFFIDKLESLFGKP